MVITVGKIHSCPSSELETRGIVSCVSPKSRGRQSRFTSDRLTKVDMSITYFICIL